MARLDRFLARIFGSGAGTDQIAKFGSLLAGSPAFTTDPSVAQELSNWLTGWFGAAIGGNAPAIEDMNAAFFVLSYQIAYQMQAGVAEWNEDTTYYIGNLVNDGLGAIYVSRTDDNSGNLLSSAANWTLVSGKVLTTLGDTFYGSTNGSLARLAGNTTAVRQFLGQTGTGIASAAPSWQSFTPPTVQRFLTGSGTYTKPAGVLYLKVRIAGGGGGGGGAKAAAGTSPGTAGAASTFGSSLLTANGGGFGTGDGGVGGAGGTVSVGVGATTIIANTGGHGNANLFVNNSAGAGGGQNALGGGGSNAARSSAGVDAVANTGGGGGGGGAVGGNAASDGGGAGGYIEAFVTSPSASYAYSVGAGGAGGTATVNGGAGAAGIIVVEEFYQ